MDHQVQMLLRQADQARVAHQWTRAIDLLRRALTIDPDHPRAHASLALALLGAQRLHGATVEVGLALAFDGNDAFCHYAAAAVRRAERRLDEAWDHIMVSLQSDSTDLDAHVLGADIKVLTNDTRTARELLLRALEDKADHVEALTSLARIELHDGNLTEATRIIDLALTAAPANVEAHVVSGWITLRLGDDASAERHARFALGEDAVDRDALRLWTAIKARRSKLLGMWWRWNAFVSLRSEAGQIGLQIGSFVVIRLLAILCAWRGWDTAEKLVSYSWFAFCGYTWFAPTLFRRMLESDLGTVTLRKDF